MALDIEQETSNGEFPAVDLFLEQAARGLRQAIEGELRGQAQGILCHLECLIDDGRSAQECQEELRKTWLVSP